MVVKNRTKLISSILLVCMVIGLLGVYFSSLEAYASQALVEEFSLVIDGTECEQTVSEIDISYPNNRYVNMREIAEALADTDAHFSYEITKEGIELDTNGVFETDDNSDDSKKKDSENVDESSEESNIVRVNASAKYNDFLVDGEKVTYSTAIVDHNDSGESDCFIAPYDLAMILGIDIQIVDDSKVVIDTKSDFQVDPEKLEADGYFLGVNAIAVGNASTGELYYSYQGTTPYAIASTTKLMTYLVLREWMSKNNGSMNDLVTISQNVEILSGSDDGVIPMKEGTKVSVNELIYGMLVVSSNESALALAEYAYGTEEAFVAKMNERALDLGLTTAHFNNSNGLPKYTDSTVSAKLQNTLSAEDMFKLSSYILSVYPEIKDVTSTKECTLEVLKQEIKNTNPVLRNMKECTGLKTGTTNKAGACLVVSLQVETGAGLEDLVVVELGAENSVERARVGQLLSRYALDVRNGKSSTLFQGGEEVSDEIPTSAEGFINLLTRAARNKSLSAN